MTNRQKLFVSAAGVAFIGLMASPALAQPATTAPEEADTGGLQEIVVTAQKRAENLQNVPIAVTALSTSELTGANVDGQLTLPKLTPNLNFTVVSTFASAYIRGVGTQFANPGLESSVSVYLDDVYVPRAASGMFTFNDIARIEVLKGPQGTLYGRNATGGAIRIITNDPKPEFEGAASVTYGTDNRIAVDGMVNVPLGEGIALRVAGRHDENDGYMRNIIYDTHLPVHPLTERKMQRRNEELYTAKLLMEPSDDITIKISGDYERKDDNEGNAFQNLFPSAPEQIGLADPATACGHTTFYDICNDAPSYNNIYSWGLAGRADFDLGPAILSSITAYRREWEKNCADLDGTGANVQWSCGKPDTKQFTQELQIASDNSGPIKYVAGLYYLWERSRYHFSVNGGAIDAGFGGLGALLGLTPPLIFQSGGKGVSVESIAPYAQIDYEVSDQFTVTVGGRYTYEKKKLLSSFGGLAELGPEGFPVPGTFIHSITGICHVSDPPQPTDNTVLCSAPRASNIVRKFTPKLTLSYKPTDGLLLYATASRGFKSGGFNLPAFGAVDSVKPEVLDDLEVGWKFQQGNIRFNGAAFYYDYKDLQIQLTDQTSGGTRVKNAAAAEIWGVEADLTWVASDQFEFGAGGGYLSTKYKNFRGDAYVPCGEIDSLPGGDPEAELGKARGRAACTLQGNLGLALVGGQILSGNKLVNAPEFSGYIRGQFTQPLDGMGQIALSSILNYRTKAYFDPANRFPDKKRMLLSARLQWSSEDEKYFVAVFGENLTKKKFYYSRPAQATGGWQTPAPPRQIYVQAGVKF